MKRQTIIIIIVGLVVFGLGWWSMEMYEFADGVKQEAVRLDSLRRNDPTFGQITEEKLVKAGIQLKTDKVYNDGFDINHFVDLTDSLLTSLSGKNITLNFTTDNTTTATIIKKRFDFDPGKDNKMFRFWIKCMTYTDKQELDKDFEALQKEANGDAADDMMPGLTYTNDYVIKTDQQIFWLNTGCVYAYFNHDKVKQNLLQSLDIDAITDSIICKCGKPKCNQ